MFIGEQNGLTLKNGLKKICNRLNKNKMKKDTDYPQFNTQEKDLNYYKNNAEEDYMTTPISVLRYITELETELEKLKLEQ